MMQAALNQAMEAAAIQAGIFLTGAALAAVLLLSLAWLAASGIMRHPR